MYTVKLGDKEWLGSEQPGVSEQFWDDQKVPYLQVRLYYKCYDCK